MQQPRYAMHKHRMRVCGERRSSCLLREALRMSFSRQPASRISNSCPIRMVFASASWLRSMISRALTLYAIAMALTVSPAWTIWMIEPSARAGCGWTEDA